MSSFLKDPAASLEYLIDWAGVAGAAAVTTSCWQVEPGRSGGLRVAAQARSGHRCAVTLEGGRAGAVYRVTNQITWSDGRSDSRALNVRVDVR